MLTKDIHAAPPDTATVFNALRAAAEALGENFAYEHDGIFHFCLGDGWSISVCPESAARLRLQACRFAVPVATLWSSAEDIDRLQSLVRELHQEISQVRT